MRRRRQNGPFGTTAAAIARAALLPALFLVPCGAGAEEARAPAPQAVETEPEFRPGIPSLKMVDVRDHKLLWRDIEELQVWERGDRISIAEYRTKVIEKTAHFLGLDGAAADGFTAAAAAAVAAVRESFLHHPPIGGESGDVDSRFSSDLAAAVTRVSSLLRQEPRHRLFAPGCKKWLLKLAFGPGEAKEARADRTP